MFEQKHVFLHSDIAKLRKESLILRDLKCEYIISLEGLLYSDNQFSLVLEYAPNGSCYDLFRKLREARLCQPDENKIWPLKCRIGEEVFILRHTCIMWNYSWYVIFLPWYLRWWKEWPFCTAKDRARFFILTSRLPTSY